LIEVKFHAEFQPTSLHRQCGDLSFEYKVYILTKAAYLHGLAAIKIHHELVRDHVDVIGFLGSPDKLKNQFLFKLSVQHLCILFAAKRQKGG
jgi:hypothetical protein